MFTYAPRPNPNFSPFLPLLVLVFWLGLLCWTKPAYGFHFKDYGPAPHLTPPDAVKARAVELEDLFGQRQRAARDASYSLVAEALRADDDLTRIVLLLVLVILFNPAITNPNGNPLVRDS